jgi:hypothetical protein
MARQTRRKGEGGPPPARFLGPIGPRVQVDLSDHAARDRYFRRCFPLGIPLEEVLARARLPNAGRPDRTDPDEPWNRGKFHRFVRLDGTMVRRRLFKLVCITEEETAEPLPGRFHIVTLIDLGG